MSTNPYSPATLPIREVAGAVLLLVGFVGLVFALWLMDYRAGLVALSVGVMGVGVALGMGGRGGDLSA